MNIQDMRDKKREMGYTYEMIARMAGVSIATVKKIFSGDVKSPRYETLRRLERAFAQEPPGRGLGGAYEVRELPFIYDVDDDSYTTEDYDTFPEYASVEIINGKIYPRYPSEPKSESRFRQMTFDELVRDPRNGSYTCEDYACFPDDIRVEIVRGRIYALATPTLVHQQIVGELFAVIRAFIRANGGSCVAGVSPVDVELMPDSLTSVQPDIYVACDKRILQESKIQGAPDLIIEVLSPSTAAYDRTVKLDDYRDAGVRELWFVDYDGGRVLVNDFENERSVIYGIRDTVPVSIFDGALKIDFAEIDDYIKSITEA
ncbi:MAG: Uma2 family endonuclease [Bacillota bacterium]|nr:Uma2 family endonuclease [Bacillota bacterium]